MTKIVKAKYKISRRLGASIWGDAKDPVHSKNYRPGQHGQSGQVKTSDFGIHLKAKQKLKGHYGRITEKQFRKTFAEAERLRGNTGENFVGLLERRLDMVVYRLNLAPTIFAARQLVSHKHIKLNGKILNVPSASVKIDDEIELVEKSKQNAVVMESVQKMNRQVPDYLSFDEKAMSGKFLRVPASTDIPYPFDPEINLIIEFYSK